VSSRIDIPVKPSNRVGLLASAPWLGLTGFNLILANAYGAVFLGLIPLALAGAIYQWNLNGRLRLARSVIRLTITSDGLQLQQRNGEQYPVTANSGSRLYPRLVILKLNPSDATNRASTMLLWSDEHGTGNVSGDLHRRLRAWLRLGSAGGRPQQNH
jgi:toxin CptA